MTEQKIAQKRSKEKQIVRQMTLLYCQKHHGTAKNTLCPACRALLAYADARIEHCPRMEQKSFCSRCPHPCYRQTERKSMQEVMRYSGPRMLLYHPVLTVRHMLGG